MLTVNNRTYFGNTWENSRVRCKLVKLIFVIYFLLIFEGALRKWVFFLFPDAVFFIRVPFVLLLYYFALKYFYFFRSNVYFLLGMVFFFVLLCLIPVQMLLGGYSARYLIVAAYGLHNYVFYIPAAFIIAVCFMREDVIYLVRATLIVAICSVPLVIAQSFAATDSFLVRGFGGHFVGLQSSGVIRPMGFFTSSPGQQMFVTSVAAFVFSSWVSVKVNYVSNKLLIIATLSLLPLLGLSFQRGVLVHVAIVLIFVIIGSMLSKCRKLAFRLLLAVLILALLALFFPLLFPDGFEIFYSRIVDAHQTEAGEYKFGELGLLSRVLYQLFKFLLIVDDVPLFGYLLGIGGNAALQLSWVDLPSAWSAWDGPAGWAEDGLSMNIVDLGLIFGPLYIVYRYMLFFWVFRLSLEAARQYKEILPITLVGFISPLLLFLQINGQGTLTGYVWLFFGFCLAAIKLSKKEAHRERVILHQSIKNNISR